MQITEEILDRRPMIRDESFLYFDIETTGFSRDRTILYLIGCAWFSGGDLHLMQFFNDDGASEREILFAFAAKVREEKRRLVHFNGNRFDLPYLNRRYALHGIDFSLDGADGVDLYQLLRPFRSFFSLEKGRQKDWERWLLVGREDAMDGGKLIAVYKQYLRSRSGGSGDPSLCSLLLLHNRDDVAGLTELLSLTRYLPLFSGGFVIENLAPAGDGFLSVSCRLKEPVPRAYETALRAGQIRIADDRFTVTLPCREGRLKHFYANYKEYYYLPQEDRAIHKSVARYVDRAHREPATAKNCYLARESVYLPLPAALAGEFSAYQENPGDKEIFADFDEIFGGAAGKAQRYVSAWIRENGGKGGEK